MHWYGKNQINPSLSISMENVVRLNLELKWPYAYKLIAAEKLFLLILDYISHPLLIFS